MSASKSNDWDALPWLLTGKQVLAASGLTSYELRKLTREGLLQRHRPGRQGKFFKSQIIGVLRVEKQ